MKKVLITLNEETVNLLKNEPNKSAYIRSAIKRYSEDISDRKLTGLRTGYKVIAEKLSDIDSKIDYIVTKIKE